MLFMNGVTDYCDARGSIYLEIKIVAGWCHTIIPATVGHAFTSRHTFVIFLMHFTKESVTARKFRRNDGEPWGVNE